MTNLIDLTRQGSVEGMTLGDLMDSFVSNCLTSKFAHDLVSEGAFSLLPLSQNVTSNTTATDPIDLLRKFKEEFSTLSNAKVKRLMEENPTFLTVLMQNVSEYKFQKVVSGENRTSTQLEEYVLSMDCFLTIFLALEDYLFMIIDQNPNELFQDFFSIISQILAQDHSSLQDKLTRTSFAKLITYIFRILTTLLLVLNRSLKASLSDGIESTDNIQASLEAMERERTVIELLAKLKSDYNELIPKVLSFLSSDADIYGRTIATSLQKYLFELTDTITADLCLLLLEILTYPVSVNLPSAITVMEKVKKLPSLTDYFKLLTTICFYDKIYLFPALVQNILKCHAAISSFILLALPTVGLKGSSASSQSKASSSSSGGAIASKGVVSRQPILTSPTKNSIQHYFSDMKSDDLGDLSIRKRKFGELKKSSNLSQQERIQQILSLFQYLLPKLLEYLDIANDIVSQFLFSLYQHLYPTKTSLSLWNYRYSPKSTSQLITILVPFLYLTHHPTLAAIARLLLSVIIRFECLEEEDERPKYPQFSSFTTFQQQQTTVGKDISSLMTIFATKKGISYSLYFLTGISMILKDERGNSVAMAFQQVMSPLTKEAMSASSNSNNNLTNGEYPKSLFYKLLPEMIELILKLFLVFYSSSIIGDSRHREEDRESYAALTNDILQYLLEIHQQHSSKAFLSQIQIIPTTNERLFLQCLQKDMLDLIPFILLFATPTSSLRKEVQRKQDSGIQDIFSHLEDREEEQRDISQNKRQKISAMLDSEQQWKQKKAAEEEADSLWKWMDANRLPSKPNQKVSSSVVASSSSQRAAGIAANAASSSLLRKAGVVDNDWKRQMDALKREKELARQKVKDQQLTTGTGVVTIKRQGSSSFMTMADESNDPKKGGSRSRVDDDQEEEEEVVKKPVVLFDIHKYMKDQKEANHSERVDPVLTEQERSLLETKRLLEAINRREHFYQFRDSNTLDTGNIGDSILSVSIDSICKDILNLPLASLITESVSEEKILPKSNLSHTTVKNNTSHQKDLEEEEEEEEIEEGEIIITKKKSLQRGDSITISTKKELQPLPLRFTTAEQYINAFQPLLVEEFIAALTAQILNEDQFNTPNQPYHHRYSSPTDRLKEFNEIYVQTDVIAIKSTDPGLMEIQIRIDDSYYFAMNRNSSNNNNRHNSNNKVPHLDLQKDELVLVLKGHSLPSSLRQRKELVKMKHFIGIITNTAPRKRQEMSAHHTPMNQGPSHTILVKRTTDIHPKQPLLVIPMMNLSTFLREWTALHSIHNPTLVPLAPYLMSGSPVCSPATINSLSDRIQSKIRAIENMKRLLSSTPSTNPDPINDTTINPSINPIVEDLQKLESSLYQEIMELDQLNVDPSVLKATGIAKLLVSVVKRAKKTATDTTTSSNNSSEAVEVTKLPSYVPLAEGLIERWRQLVREQSNAETIKNLKGGKVIKIPSKEEITLPRGITPSLWTVLSQRYNESQLYAIKYVVSQFDSKQDTRIGLIQGPPGSGKTSTIIGIVSALLNYSGFVTTSSTTTTTSSATATVNIAKQHLMPYTVAPTTTASSLSSSLHSQRILICAPSNAAIDEILTRLTISGIYNQEGQLVSHALKIVRLGEAGGNHHSSSFIHSLTLDYQIEQKLHKEDLYHKYLTLQDHLQQLELQYSEKLAQNRSLGRSTITSNTTANTSSQPPTLLETQLSILRRQLYEYRNNKLLYEISLDRLRSQFRQQLLFEANIVGTTLSSAGKQQFLDYIMKENVFFTTCIIDEAGQTTEPSTLIPLRFGCRRLVLVGDPRQLPATVLSRKAEKYGLGRSLFERLEKAEHEVVMLTMQYRMHPEIRSFPSKYFYQNLLIDSSEIQEEIALVTSIQNQSLLPIYGNYRVISPKLLQLKIPPVLFLNIPQAKESKQGKSFINELEITYILQFLVFLTQQQIIRPSPTTNSHADTKDSSTAMTVAIISPYKAQVRLLQQRCAQHSVLKDFFQSSVPPSTHHSREDNPAVDHHSLPIIEINTVDGFQGREKDIVLISTVRANQFSSVDRAGSISSSSATASSIRRIGFVADERRLNVAITRGRKCLVVFGHRDTLLIDPVWREMIQSVSDRNYLKTPEQLSEIFHNS